MLPEVTGTSLANPGPSDFVREQDLCTQFEDLPPTVLRQDPRGQNYLAILTASDDTANRWIYLPVKREHLRQVLTGEITLLTAVKKVHQFLVVDQAAETGDYIKTIMVERQDLKANKALYQTLPAPTLRMNVSHETVDAWENQPASVH